MRTWTPNRCLNHWAIQQFSIWQLKEKKRKEREKERKEKSLLHSLEQCYSNPRCCGFFALNSHICLLWYPCLRVDQRKKPCPPIIPKAQSRRQSVPTIGSQGRSSVVARQASGIYCCLLEIFRNASENDVVTHDPRLAKKDSVLFFPPSCNWYCVSLNPGSNLIQSRKILYLNFILVWHTCISITGKEISQSLTYGSLNPEALSVGNWTQNLWLYQSNWARQHSYPSNMTLLITRVGQSTDRWQLGRQAGRQAGRHR